MFQISMKLILILIPREEDLIVEMMMKMVMLKVVKEFNVLNNDQFLKNV